MTHTTVFDSLSRAIENSYSGCYIYSQFPYDIRIYYDDKNRPIRLQQKLAFFSPKKEEVNIEKIDDSVQEFLFQYNSVNEIIKLRNYKNKIGEERAPNRF